MLVYGRNSCEEFLINNGKIKKVYLDKNFSDNKLISLIEKKKIKPIFYNKFDLDELADGNHQGIIIDAGEYEYCDIDEIIKDNGFIVMLDHLEDTHNFGAIIRTCEAAGVDGIIIPKDRSVKVNSTVMKTSSGAAINMKICMVTNLNQTIETLKKHGFWVVASDGEAKQSYSDLDYNMKVALIVGSEGKGISSLVLKNADFVTKIPMFGHVNSLNASVATGIYLAMINEKRKGK